MNREYKFRGKRLDTGEWVYGFVYQDEFKSWIITEEGFQSKPNDVNGPAEYATEVQWYEVDPKTVGQYTGLKDKNGKEIYEGDILRFIVNGEEFTTSPVEYKTTLSAYAAGVELGSWYPEDMGVMPDDSAYEIIGNIYENLTDQETQ